MNNLRSHIFAGLALAATVAFAHGQPLATANPVTADNFTRAESDTYFANIVKQAGGPGKFFHRREIEPVENQIVIRANRDTLYSAGVFDLDAGHNAEGNFQKNAYDAYSLNNITAKKSADGSVAVQFGGCDGKIPNCLPTMPGWNYMVRFYRPRAEILNGSWKFPQPQPVT